MDKLIFSALVLLTTSFSYAHAPFVAPYQFLVQGGNTAITAGFADAAFDTEVAIRGFEFVQVNPKGEQSKLELTNTKTLSVADLAVPLDGSYQILGQRQGELKYAKVANRWMRVLDAKADNLPPLSEREFIATSEVTAKMLQKTSIRHDEVLTYVSKKVASDLAVIAGRPLNIKYSLHPNQLSQEKPLLLSAHLNGKIVQGLNVVLEKRINSTSETASKLKASADEKGQLELKFPSPGQYILTLNTPEFKKNGEPEPEIYRTIISLNVAP